MWLGRSVRIQMMPRALRRWQGLSAGDKAVLEFAFQDAMHNPQLVPSYQSWMVSLKRLQQLAEVHRLRIGDANFLIVETINGQFLWDLWLQKHVPMDLAAE